MRKRYDTSRRERLANAAHAGFEQGPRLIVGRHDTALAARTTYVHTREDNPSTPDQHMTRKQCCSLLRTAALKQTLDGSGPRYRLDLASGKLRPSEDREPWHGVIVGARADEEDAEAVEDEEDGEVPLEEPVIDLADGDDAEDAGEGDGEEDEELEDFEDDVLLGDEAGDEELEELGEDPEDLAKL